MTIRLQDICMRAYHGLLPEERQHGNTFRVNVALTMPDMPAMQTDLIDGTIDYRQVYDIVRREMEIPSDLLEHVAWRIKQALLQQLGDEVSVSISVSKQNPPLGGEVAWATVEI